MAERVEARRHHQHARCEILDPFKGMVEVAKVAADRRAAFHGQIAVVTFAGAASNLVGIAADEWK
ncbi:hypothetical protein D3C71_2108190 [compost metagenome]